MDDNDRLAAGTLPADPEADTETMGPPPQGRQAPPLLARKLSDLLTPAFVRMRRRQSGEERPIPVPWETLAKPLGGGLWPGLHVLVGNTGHGKTQFCLQAALHAAHQGTPVLYVALEAGDVEFVARCVSLETNTPWSPLFHGRRKDLTDLTNLMDQAGSALEELPLAVLFGPSYGWSADALPAEVEALRKAHLAETPEKPLLVILDFLQIIGAKEGQREELRERIGKAAYVGRAVAREQNAAVLLASSTSRENYLALAGRRRNAKKGVVENDSEKLGHGDPVRFVGLGKESGEIEYAADTVLVLAQEPWPDDTPPPEGTVCHLALAKVRARIKDQPGWVELRFNGRAFTEPKPEERHEYHL